jgi:hypothetical protein
VLSFYPQTFCTIDVTSRWQHTKFLLDLPKPTTL